MSLSSRHSTETRHLNIKKNQIGTQRSDFFNRFLTVTRFPHDLHFRVGLQESSKLHTSESFIINQQR